METESNKLKDENEFLEKEIQQKVLLLKRMERELEIEASLERVRTRSMAMNRSEELLEIAELIYHEVIGLNVHIEGVGFSILNTENTEGQWFVYNGFSLFKRPVKVNMGKDKYLLKAYLSWKNGEDRMVNDLEGDELQMHNQNLMSLLPIPEELIRDEALKKAMEQAVDTRDRHLVYHFNFVDGVVFFSNGSPIEEVEVLGRFFKVFEQTYTRFLDLKKAEAQAREAQIEAALERIRAASMAMHKSEELPQVALTLLAQIEKLALPVLGVAIPEVDAEKDTVIVYFADNTKEVGTQELTSTGEFKVGSFWQSEESVKRIKSGEQEFTIIADADRIRLWIEFVDEWISKERASRLRAANFSKVYFHFIQYHGLSPITISSLGPLTEEHQSLIRRLVATFAMSYRRYLDLKKAEAQAREAQIEAALERIRTASMAMHKSEELPNVALTLLAQIEKLALPVLGVAISEVDAEKETAVLYFADNTKEGTQELTSTREFEINSFWQSDESFKRTKSGEQEFTLIAEAERIHLWIDFVDKWISKERASRLRAANLSKVYFHYVIHHELSAIVISSLGPLTEEHQSLIRRLVATFAMSYRRYLDLKKAEAQAREAQIEASLERIRASTMAMHHSQELLDAAKILFLQFEELGIELDVCGFSIMEKDSPVGRQFLSIGGTLFPEPLPVSYDTDPQLKRAYNAWKERQSELILDIQGEELKQHLAHNLDFLKKSKAFDILSNTAAKFNDNKVQVPNRLVVQHAYFKDGYLFVTSRKPIENSEILLRFAKVFEQTYTRFLDLQKAEAQAREAQIEAALERVRSRTMAMQKSEELPEVVQVVFEQFNPMNLDVVHSWVTILLESDEFGSIWSTEFGGYSSHPKKINLPLDHPAIQAKYDQWKKGDPFLNYHFEGDEVSMWMDNFNVAIQDSFYPTENRPEYLEHMSVNHWWGEMSIATTRVMPQEAKDIIARFARVFDQSFTRFLDLKKAEAQARESHIEAAMERIRSTALAMRSSDEIMDVITEIRRQIDSLGQVDLEASVVHLYKKGATMFESIAAVRPPGESGEIVLANVMFPVNATDRIKYMISMYESDVPEYTIVFDKQMAEEWQQVMVQYAPMIANRRIGFVENRRLSDRPEYWNFSDFTGGSLLLVTHSPASEDTKNVLRKASVVFDLAYRRYIDLQLAESQAKDAIRQASLDRVRAEIASMRSTEDLQRITPLIWHELTVLGVPFFRCGVFIIDEAQEIVHSYLSTPEGHSLAVMELPFDVNEMTTQVVTHWKQNRVFKEHWDKEQFVSWMQSMVEQHRLQNPTEYQASPTPPESLFLHFIPFKQGMLYVGSTEVLSEDEIELVQTLAAAFSIAYARYEDFKQLEEAKTKVEATLDELKSTQAQLIQSEKMASLGELTAGIAHEIQNPLNFVNNYSEVNVELIEEIKEEIEKGNALGILELVTDLEDNETKIVHHGKRADAIVRGMLQHSRTNSGTKEPTDLNALTDEYLRLSYHGLRAKDSSFQADYSTDFDDNLPMVEVVPQDIGRVLLNVINYAFQACHERCCAQIHPDYAPKVTISTQNRGEFIEICIQDNGGGIPEAIKDKIFQPFFTTKPTGQGTGLGLSLAYDSVKAHGGELSVESNEGEGTTFILSLPI